MFQFDLMWKTFLKNKNYKRKIKEVNFNEINLDEYFLLDVRSRREFNEFHLKGSSNIPLLELKKNAIRVIQDKNKKILVYCQSGVRSKKAIIILENLGYTNIYNLKNGLENIEKNVAF